MSKLYRMLKGGLERVRCELQSLHPSCAAVLISSTSNVVFVFVGAQVSRVDRVRADTLAEQIRADRKLPSVVVIEQSQLAQTLRDPVGETFWREFNIRQNNIRDAERAFAKKTNEPRNSPVKLWVIENGKKGALVATLVSDSGPDSQGSVRPLEVDALDPMKAYMIMAGPCELMLWLGNKVSIQDRPLYTSFAQQHLARNRANRDAEVNVIRARLEPPEFLFYLGGHTRGSPQASREKRSPSTPTTPVSAVAALAMRKNDIDIPAAVEAKRRSSATIATQQDDSNKRSIAKELERMTNEYMGTMGIVANGIGDNSRGLKMALIQDESATLRVWCVKDGRQLVQIPVNEPYCFDSHSAYGVLYVCKGGARAIMYLWVGRDCGTQAQAALAMQTRDILKDERVAGAVEQIRVDQGRESALFMGIFSMHAYHPFVCTFEQLFDSPTLVTSAPRGHVRAFETICVTLGLAHEGTYTQQCVFEKLKERGMFSNRAYVFASVGESGKVECLCLCGAQASEMVRDHCSKWATIFATKFDGEVRVVPWSEAHDPELGLGLILVHNINVDKRRGRPARPNRMWSVSNDKRSLGTMFVEEIGQGATYVQEDLHQRDGTECFIIDDTSVVYVRHGPRSDLPTRYLVTRVARAFAQAMDLQSQATPTQVVHVESGSEPAELRCLFRTWDLSQCDEPNATARNFDPSRVGAEDDMGHVPDPAPTTKLTLDTNLSPDRTSNSNTGARRVLSPDSNGLFSPESTDEQLCQGVSKGCMCVVM